MTAYNLRYVLESLHRYKRGARPVMVSVTRKRGTSDFSFCDPLFGDSVLRGDAADLLVALGWCQIQALDAYTEYLSTTEAGRAVIKDGHTQ